MNNMLFNPTVLVVDDEKSVRDVLARYFSRRGFSVLLAATGMEAMEIFKQHRPHIVLLDILMSGGMDGVQTLSELRKIDSSFKAVMISAVKDEEVFSKCRELGALDYILKPFDFASLDARVAGKILW